MKKRIMALLLSATMVTTVLGNVSFVSHATNSEELAVVTVSTDDASPEDDYSDKGDDSSSDVSEDSDLIDDKNLDESSESDDDFSSTEESKDKTEYDNAVTEKDSGIGGDVQWDEESVSTKESDDETEDEKIVESSHGDKKDSDEVAAENNYQSREQKETDQDDIANDNSDILPSDLDNKDGSTEDNDISENDTQAEGTESTSDMIDDISDETDKETDQKESDNSLIDDLGDQDNKALSEETNPADELLNVEDELDSDEKDKLSDTEDKIKKAKENKEAVTEIKTTVDGMTIIVSGEDLTDITVSAKTVELEDDILDSYYENAEIIKAVDITLFDAGQNEWQPEENGQTVSVEIRGIDLPETDEPVSVVRIDDSVIDNSSEANSETVQVVSEDAAIGEDSVEFDAEHFTVYAMILNGGNSYFNDRGTCGESITWSVSGVSNNLTLTLTGTGDMYSFERDGNNKPDTPWKDYSERIKHISFDGSITSIGQYAFSYCNCEAIEIPNTVQMIRSRAFWGSEVKTIYLPDGIKGLDYECFLYCKKLTSLHIPSSVTFIGEAIVEVTPCLKSISVDPKNEKYDSRDSCNAIILTAENKLIAGCSTTTIPEGITKIATHSLANVSLANSISFPSTLTAIDSYAMYACPMDDLVLNEGLLSIGAGAFEGCSIKTLHLPDSLTELGSAAFRDNDLIKLVLPTGLRELQWGVFRGNHDLVYVSIPSGLETIGQGVFENCEKLEEVNIDKSVTYIGENNFNYVKNIYYSGNESEWNEITGKEFIPDTATIHFSTSSAGSLQVACGNCYHNEENGGGIGKINLKIDESVFLASSNNYNHEIAKYACGLSTMAYSTNLDNTDNTDSIRACFHDLGYDDASNDLYYYKDYEGGTATFWIAKKSLDEDTLLITVLIRGTDGKEWFSNFNSGTGDTHQGFVNGSNTVLSALAVYLKKLEPIDKNIKILITGHSRGAAIANLLGHCLNENGLSGKLEQDNIFVYTFATPNVAQTNFCESNIFNIVNPEDFVTKVLPSKWGYSRYGLTYVLPSKSNTNWGVYQAYLNKLKTNFSKYAGRNERLYEPYRAGMATVCTYINEVTNKVHNINKYYEKMLHNYQNVFNGSFSLHDLYIDTLATYCAGDTERGESNIYDAAQLKYGGLGLRTAEFFGLHQGAFKKFEYGHQAETYLAAMNSLSADELLREKRTVGGIVDCPVDVCIIDSDGKTVGEIKDNTIMKQEDGVSLIVEGDSKFFFFPADSDFQVMLTGNDTGYMDYSLNCFDCDTLDGARLYYHDVPLEKGTTYIDEISSNVSFEDYQIFDVAGNSVSKTIISEEDNGALSVIVTVEGEGTADSFYNLTPGDHVQMEAYPLEGNHFVGWYKDGNLISTDSVYGFSIANDENFVAKFAAGATVDNGNDDSNNSGDGENTNTNNSNNNYNAGNSNTNSATIQNNNATVNTENNGAAESNNKPAVQDNNSTNPSSNTTQQNTTPSTNTSTQQNSTPSTDTSAQLDTGSTESVNSAPAQITNTTAKSPKVKLNYTKLTLGKGGRFTLAAKVTGATKKTTIKWSSSNKKVATVNKKGEITAKAKGKCVITAKTADGKVKATCKLTIKKDPIKVKKATVNKKSISLKKGKTFNLKAGFTPYNATISSITYATSDKKIATVSKKGVVKAKKKGKCTITVKIT